MQKSFCADGDTTSSAFSRFEKYFVHNQCEGTPEEVWRAKQEKIRLEEEARERERQRLRTAVQQAMEERGWC